jgi:hypothetical protein
MNPGRRTCRNVIGALALPMLLAVGSSACARKTKTAKHGAEEAPAIVVPTPDNTPIPALRTPAGLVLKLEEPGPATPTPPTTPAAIPSPNPTP